LFSRNDLSDVLCQKLQLEFDSESKLIITLIF
jgi:hypothetical protein